MYQLDLEKFKAKSYDHLHLTNKRVLLRTCLNVITDKAGNIVDDTRLQESLPLIRELAKKAKYVLVTGHLGRPKHNEPEYSFVKIAVALANALGQPVHFVTDLGDLSQMESGVYLLENVRFRAEEDAKDEFTKQPFVKALTAHCDLFINDAFADYRTSVSTYDVAKVLPSYLGPVFAREVLELDTLANPDRPFVAILGGSKLSEKLDSLLALLKSADKVLVGGAMRYTLLKAMGIKVGKSLVEDDKLDVAKEIIAQFSDKLVLPDDHMIIQNFQRPVEGEYKYTEDQRIPEGREAIDIGPKGIARFVHEIAQAKTIVWNGPVGVFEWEVSAQGTKTIGEAIAANIYAYTLVGGGDSISAIHMFGLKGFNHISTGGGAMLSYLAYEEFPTLDVILK